MCLQTVKDYCMMYRNTFCVNKHISLLLLFVSTLNKRENTAKEQQQPMNTGKHFESGSSASSVELKSNA